MFALKLAFLLFLQLAFLLYVAIVCGVFKNKEHNTEFIGHLGPGMFLVGIGVFEMVSIDSCHITKVEVLEAWTSLLGSSSYLAFSIWKHGMSLDFLGSYSAREQQHDSLMLLILTCGLARLALSSAPRESQHLAIVTFSLGFGFFTAQHMQPNLVGYLVHYGTCCFTLLFAIARISEVRFLAGAFAFMAGTTFYFGQRGIVMFIDENQASPAGALLSIVTVSLVFVVGYIILFQHRQEQSRNTSYKQKQDLENANENNGDYHSVKGKSNDDYTIDLDY